MGKQEISSGLEIDLQGYRDPKMGKQEISSGLEID